MQKVARITTQPGGRPSLLIIDPGAALGLSLARAVRRYGCDAVIATSVAHAISMLARQPVHLLIVHETRAITPGQVAMLRQSSRGRSDLPCVVLGVEGSRLVSGDVRLVQTPVETDAVMRAIKASLGVSRARRKTPTLSQARRISSFRLPAVHGEFSMPEQSADAATRETEAAAGAGYSGYSVQSRKRETLRMIPTLAPRSHA